MAHPHRGDPSPCHARPFRAPSSGNAPSPRCPSRTPGAILSVDSSSAHPLLPPLLLSRWDSPLPCRNPPWLPALFPNLHLPGGGGHRTGLGPSAALSPHPSLPCPTALNSLRVHNYSIPSHRLSPPPSGKDCLQFTTPRIPTHPSVPFLSEAFPDFLSNLSSRIPEPVCPASSPLDAPSTHSMLLQKY